MSDKRLPAHIEVTALIRATQSAGGIATVLNKGERDAGTILIVTIEPDGVARFWERMPRMDGRRIFEAVRERDPANPQAFEELLSRRVAQDRDIWLLELYVADAQRFIADFAV